MPKARVAAALPDHMLSHVQQRLYRDVSPGIELAPWQEADHPKILLMAPHELTFAVRTAVLGVTDWAWVHLTSAGVDFVADRGWPNATLLTRSWRCYAAPLAEYVLHAVLRAEWEGALPWAEPDPRPQSRADAPPVPAVNLAPDRGRGLWGCRIGVAGWGEVGRRVGTTLAALGAQVTVLSRTRKSSDPPTVRHTTDVGDLVDVEHLVLALPSTPETRGLLSRAWIEQARPGMHVVNVARPEVIDQDALAEACAAGRMSATLDVTEPEPLPPDHRLRTLPSVRLSPHVAWRSRGSDYAFVEDFVDIWYALLRGGPVPGAARGSSPDRARAVLGAA